MLEGGIVLGMLVALMAISYVNDKISKERKDNGRK